MAEMACQVVAENNRKNQAAADSSTLGTAAGWVGITLPPVKATDAQQMHAVAAARNEKYLTPASGAAWDARQEAGGPDYKKEYAAVEVACDKSARIENAGTGVGIGGTPQKEKKGFDPIGNLREQAYGDVDKIRENKERNAGY